MGNELPYMPTFIGDFMAAVASWPPDRVGAYWLALMYQWENGGIPANDPRELAAILHTSRPIAIRLWGEIESKFHRRADGKWWNAKAEAVRIEAKRQFMAKIDRAHKGANARWGKGANGAHEHSLSIAQALPEHCLSNANQNQNQSTPPKPPARAGGRKRNSIGTQLDAEHQRRTQEVKQYLAEGLSLAEASRKAGYQ